jgi:hypothetical protein
MFGRLTHLAFDALLVTAFLAGIRRTTGLTYAASSMRMRYLPNAPTPSHRPALTKVPNKDVRRESRVTDVSCASDLHYLRITPVIFGVWRVCL